MSIEQVWVDCAPYQQTLGREYSMLRHLGAQQLRSVCLNLQAFRCRAVVFHAALINATKSLRPHASQA